MRPSARTPPRRPAAWALAISLALVLVFAPRALAVSGTITVNPADGSSVAQVNAAGGSMTFIELSLPGASGQGTTSSYRASGVEQPCNDVSYGISCSFNPTGGPTSMTIPFAVSPIPPDGSTSFLEVGISGGSREQVTLIWRYTQSAPPPPPPPAEPRRQRLTPEEKEELREELRDEAREAIDTCQASPVGDLLQGVSEDPGFAKEVVRESLNRAVRNADEPRGRGILDRFVRRTEKGAPGRDGDGAARRVRRDN